MLTPYVILVLGFALLTILCLWFIKDVEGMWAAKFILVPAVLWYGLFLYYMPPQLSGYPSDQEITDDKVIVRYYTYEAPTSENEGHIYVVVDTRFFKLEGSKRTVLEAINPSTYTDISGAEYLRLHRLPWDEKMVKDMNKAQKKKQVIVLSKNKDKKKDGEGGDGEQGKGDKKGKGKGEGEPGEAEKTGEGGTGGTARNSDDKAKYKVDALTPNDVMRKED